MNTYKDPERDALAQNDALNPNTANINTTELNNTLTN